MFSKFFNKDIQLLTRKWSFLVYNGQNCAETREVDRMPVSKMTIFIHFKQEKIAQRHSYLNISECFGLIWKASRKHLFSRILHKYRYIRTLLFIFFIETNFQYSFVKIVDTFEIVFPHHNFDKISIFLDNIQKRVIIFTKAKIIKV